MLLGSKIFNICTFKLGYNLFLILSFPQIYNVQCIICIDNLNGQIQVLVALKAGTV